MAWNKILANCGPPEVLSRFREIFSDGGDLDDRDFTVLHRIVLDLDKRDAGTYIRTCPRTEINHGDVQRQSPLHWAARRGDFKMVNLLLQGGADPNVRRFDGFYPLHLAAEAKNVHCIDRILQYGADVNARNNIQFTPLLCLCSDLCSHLPPEPDCIKQLIDRGAMINAQNFQGATALMFGSKFNYVPGMRCLLENGATIDIQTYSGETALAIAIQSNACDAVEFLLVHGADVLRLSNAGRSILHEAAECSNERVVRFLTAAQIRGLDVKLKSADGLTAWDLARTREDVTPEWRAAFLDLLASVDERPNESAPKAPHTSRGFLFKINHVPRPSALMKTVEDICSGVMIRVYRFAVWLLRQSVPSIPVLPVFFVAVVWYMLQSPRFRNDDKPE